MASQPTTQSGRLHSNGEGFPHLNGRNGACMCHQSCCNGVNGCICRSCSGIGHSGCKWAQHRADDGTYSAEPIERIKVTPTTRGVTMKRIPQATEE